MRTLSFILSICLLTFCSTANQNDITQITEVLKQQTDAWNEGNIDEYMKGYWNNDSLLFIGSNGPNYGYNRTLQRYKKAYPNQERMGTLTFSGLQIKQLCSDTYFVTGGWSLQRAEDNPKGYFTLIFKKIDGAWRIISDHSS